MESVINTDYLYVGEINSLLGRLLRDVYLSWIFLNVRKNCLYLCSIFKFSNQYHPSSEKIKMLPDSVAFQFSVCVQTNGYWVCILLHIDCVCFMLWQKCFCLEKNTCTRISLTFFQFLEKYVHIFPTENLVSFWADISSF